MHFSDIYNKVHIGKHVWYISYSQWSEVIFNLALKHAIKVIQENQEALKPKWTNQHLVFIYDTNLWDENTNFKENKDALLIASEEIGHKRKYRDICMFVFHQHNTASDENKANKIQWKWGKFETQPVLL